MLLSLAWHGALAQEPDWGQYRQVLEQYVKPGHLNGVDLNTVDYSSLKNDPLFTQVVRQIESFPLQDLDNERERLAFYVNAYNILAIKMVLDHWEVESIKDAGSLFQSVWKKNAGQLDGETVTLSDVEHRRLRPMGDPRMHMAIVCASVSCPDLSTQPYTAARLDQQLDQQTRRFLDNPAKGLRIDDGVVHLSRIFKWFKEDFAGQGGVGSFVRRYHELPAGADFRADIDYDWSLNGD